MINGTYVTACATLTLLRRDRIFIPVCFALVAISGFAVIASEWGVAEFDKILNDVGFFGFQMTGMMVAIFWGGKIVADSKTEGSIESELAAPLSRTAWLLGKYGGLAAALLLLGALIIPVWQSLLLLNGYTWLTPVEWAAFGLTILGWLVMGAVSIFWSTLMRQGVALFTVLSLWIVGLTSGAVANTLQSDTDPLTRRMVEAIAQAWDLQQFNLIAQVTGRLPLDPHDLSWRAAYGVLLILFILAVASLIFERRSLQ